MDYNFTEIEKKWQKYWKENQTFKVDIDHSKPKYYVLDMFPYPSGAGLHVGHPLGYIASDIYSRYKRLQGFNVLHPMGYDAFGLPAEQYAIQTGQHPAVTTDENISRYRSQLYKIGFSYDWSREVKTCDPKYYKWTQWTFIQLFNHWYNNKTNKAEPVEDLIKILEKEGNINIDASSSDVKTFSAGEWKSMSEKEQQETLLCYRLAYLAETMVNWCPALGTVLANDEVKDGVSLRGGHPVEQKEMRQWLLRVTAYAERLLNGLEKLKWSDSLKEIQRNWIGRSEGATIRFEILHSPDTEKVDEQIEVFTTRPDTIFGATYMVLAPEHSLVEKITTEDYKNAVFGYIDETRKKTERERLAEAKSISGQFTGAFAKHPFSGEPLQVWISDYVLAGYGTGAIMAVPAHDSRDYDFAKYFNLPIKEVISGGDISEGSYDSTDGTVINSGFLNGLPVKEAIETVTKELEKKGTGEKKVNYRLRDAIFSRQRYWGEPFPVYYKDNMPCVLDEDKLPLVLPEVDAYLPTEKGEPPLGRAKYWKTEEGYPLELSTMPGFAGSSAYYIRYMDPHNDTRLVSEEANRYWKNVDLYIGGTEHATGHLIYSRFWNKFLYDIGEVGRDEPFSKLINQGMIQGRSNFVYRIRNTNKFVSYNLKDKYDVTPIHVDVNIVHNDILDTEAFRKWNPEYKNADFITEDNDKYHCGYAIEKMSKSMYNVVTPDDIIEQYGADTLRMYEMFLGPLEQAKPWDTNGIDGVFKFFIKVWKLFHDENNRFSISDGEATAEELKILHTAIKKVRDDIERFSFNTSVSAFMICVNQLSSIKCNKRGILEKLLILLSPFAPHITEELWEKCGKKESIANAGFPEHNPDYLKEEYLKYPITFNGKMKFTLDFPADMALREIEEAVLNNDSVKKQIGGKKVKKVIVVPKKIVNIVV